MPGMPALRIGIRSMPIVINYVKARKSDVTSRIRTAATVSVAGLAIGAGLLMGTVPAGAATVTSAGQARAAGAAAEDTSWAQATAQTDLAEIAIGQIAGQRALHSDTKMMAQVTISDHTTALASLKKVAAQAGITLPAAPSATQQAQAAQLKSVASSQFDATYDAAQIKGHELSISATRTEIASGSSAAVKANAEIYLPVAEKHLQMAESDYAALGGSAPGAPGVNAGTGGLAATQPASDAPWLAAGAAGLVLLAGTGAFGVRRRLATR
jgi:putative membrane protein